MEAIVAQRTFKTRKQYLVKWEGYPEIDNTWVAKSNIDPALVATYEGKQLVPRRTAAPSKPKRGVGAARARLSTAEERRGEGPTTMSMVCGNVQVHFKEPRQEEHMPTLKLTFFVLTMDRTGHITWPIDFAAPTKAALRMQARALLSKMIDDPYNPVDSTFAPALVGPGTSGLFKPAAKRKLVEITE